MKRNTPSLYFFKLAVITFLFPVMTSHCFAQTAHIDSLLSVVKTLREDTLKIQTYREICKAYMMEVNDMDKVMEYASKTLALSQPINYRKGLSYGLFYKGVAYWSKGNYLPALDYYKKALVLMKELSIRKGENACYINMGLIYTDRGMYPEALDYLKKGIKLNEEANDKQGMQIGYDNIGNVYMFQGDYTQAMNYHFKALKIAEERKDELVISYSYNNIGDVFYAQNKLDLALLYYKKAITYMEKVKDLAGVGSCYTDIGNVYWQKKQYEEALFYHSKDLQFKEMLNDKQGTAIACSKIGFDYFAQHNLKKALYYQLKSYDLCKLIGFKKGIIDASGGIGNVYQAQQLHSRALKYYTDMLTIAIEAEYKEGIRDAYSNHASVYKALNEPEKALQYTKRYNATKDSLLNKENFKQINELNSRYQSDRKEKEILLLTRDQLLNAKIIRQHQLVRWGLIGGLGLLSISIFSIYRRYRFKQKSFLILEKQKQEIEQKNILITDSIEYAKTIQEAVMPKKERIEYFLPGSFIFYKPKAVVSGDFYWLNKLNDRIICAVADCTGHGVPGAFMSLLGYNMLENAIKKTQTLSPGSILDALHVQVNAKLSGDKFSESSKHGMDISLISFDKTNGILEYAGAHNSLYIARGAELIELKADMVSVGDSTEKASFRTNTVEIKDGDMLYLFTDGFPDQIRVPDHKKFCYQPFKELLLSIQSLTGEKQKTILEETLHRWMGNSKVQTDDILILGIRI